MKTSRKVETFSQRLHLTRKNRDLSQGGLAKKLGLTGQAQVSRYENGKSLPDVAILVKMSEALQVDLHWLITGNLSPSTVDLAERVKPYLYAHLSDVTLRIQQLERERRDLYARTVQREPRTGGIKDVEKLLAEHHAYLRAAYQELDQLVGMECKGDKDVTLSYDQLRDRSRSGSKE
ncbi:MAG: helix-turn-helix transcriptional regulator [Planctomycetes bacterium]|nr:helix-turn-helix transcriptional regulator [Planctomycetota bacterium]